MRKLVLIILFITFCLLAKSQNKDISRFEILAAYFQDCQYDHILDIANDAIMYGKHPYDDDCIYTLMFGAITSIKVNDTTSYHYFYDSLINDSNFQKKRKNVTDSIYKTFDYLNINELTFRDLTIENKKRYLSEFLSFYGFVSIWNIFLDGEDNIKILKNYLYQNIIRYLKFLSNKNSEEAMIKLEALNYVCIEAIQNLQYEIVLRSIIPEIMSIGNTKDPVVAIMVLLILNNFVFLTGLTDLKKEYFYERFQYFLFINELREYINYNDFNNVFFANNYISIKQSIKENEVIAFVFDGELLNLVHVTGVFIINDKNAEPEEYNYLSSEPIGSIMNSISKRHPNKKIIVYPINDWENSDIAYTNNNIYIKYSSFNNTKKIINNNDEILFMGNIDYGNGALKKLPYSKLEYDSLLCLYKNNFHSIINQNLRRINFLSINDNISILHISSHGIVDIIPNNLKSIQDIGKSLIGYDKWKKNSIALSNYNLNSKENSITAYDIKKLKLNNCSLVFLNTCYSGSTNKSTFGNQGLSRAFHIAGAHNIISYLNPVDDEIAAYFAITFYNYLKQSKSCDIHNSFFKAKEKTINNYIDILPKDKLNRPQFDVILWE